MNKDVLGNSWKNHSLTQPSLKNARLFYNQNFLKNSDEKCKWPPLSLLLTISDSGKMSQ